jgi:chemotaxis protein methyltransferase CheR
MTSDRQPTGATGPLNDPSGFACSLSPEQFTCLRDLLAGFSGVYLDTARQRLLEHGLFLRLRATGDDIAAYERRLGSAGGREELRRLSELVLNHETFFFRNLPHMQALRDLLLPEIDHCKPSGVPIRMWSAGCATGEEAYSLALVALETLGQPLARPVEIWATDLSEPALKKAREGFYRGRALQNLPPELLRRYFQPRDDGYVVGEAVRKLVRFAPLNLLDPFPEQAAGVDIIFCQNVTIYFQLETCQRLIARFYECLPDDGLLFLGFSETLWNIFDRFFTREVGGAYVYYKRALETTAPPSYTGIRTNISQSDPKPGKLTPLGLASSRRSRGANVTAGREKVFHDHARSDLSDAGALSRGRALLNQGEVERAFETLRRISPQSRLAPEAITLIARAHADRGDLDLAAAEVQRVLALDPLNEEAYLLLGIIYGRLGQWAEAVRQLERARYLSAESALISFYLAEAYRQTGSAKKAANEYRSTLRKLERHPPGAVLDGVAAGWLRESCQRQLEQGPNQL